MAFFLTGPRKLIENSVTVEEFQSSFEATCRKGALSYYMGLFMWNSSAGTVICCTLMLGFFFSFSRTIGSSFHMGGAAPWLWFPKACMCSRARLSTSLESHCFLLSLLYSVFWMKIDSPISKQKEKEQCYFRGGWKDNPWASKGVTKNIHFRTLFCTWFRKPSLAFQCVHLTDKWVGFYVVWCNVSQTFGFACLNYEV